MPIDPNDFEATLELLEDKMVRTSRGSYIAVEDLRNLVKETSEMKREQIREAPRYKTMASARLAALADDELRAMFDEPIPPSADAPNRAVIKEREAAQSATSA